jgi:hypothetical protein
MVVYSLVNKMTHASTEFHPRSSGFASSGGVRAMRFGCTFDALERVIVNDETPVVLGTAFPSLSVLQFPFVLGLKFSLAVDDVGVVLAEMRTYVCERGAREVPSGLEAQRVDEFLVVGRRFVVAEEIVSMSAQFAQRCFEGGIVCKG